MTRILLYGLTAGLLAISCAAHSAEVLPMAEDQELYLSVRLDEQPTALIARFRLQSGRLMARGADLAQLGLDAEKLGIGPAQDVALDEIPGLIHHYDASLQTVALHTRDGLRKPLRIDARGLTVSGAARSDRGLLLNYDVYGRKADSTRVSAWTELRWFDPQGVASHTGVAHSHRGQYIRHDSSWTRTDQQGMRTLRLGDSETGALPWTRSLRLGGIQWASNFATRPDLLTFPMPMLGGSTAVPGAIAGSGTLTISCTFTSLLATGVVACVDLAPGPSSSSVSPRAMAQGSNRLQYQLSRYPGLSPAWGTAGNGESVIVRMGRPSGQVATQSITINASVLANQFTVPTANNATTTYSEVNAGNATLKSSFYLLLSPSSCSGSSSTVLPAFTVSAPVSNNCSISKSTDMGFTGAGTLERAIDSTATLAVRCTANDAWRIKLNGGVNGTVAQRNMRLQSGSALLPYLLYRDAASSLLWGDGSGGTAMHGGTGTGAIQTVTVYGRVPAQAAAQPGSYQDTVTATIEF